MPNRILISMFFLLLSSCTTYQSEGLLSIDEQDSFQYKHSAISPETDNSIKGPLVQVLKSKGFIVYQANAFRNVIGIKPGNSVLVFVCNDSGRTDRGLGSWSQSVECVAYDLHSEEIVYEGIGEYMGVTVSDDYRGATIESLKRLPLTGSKGKITSVIDLPHEKSVGKRTYRGRKIMKGASSQGTAWLMPKGYVVTNYHVIEGASDIKLIAHDSKELKAKIFREDKINDIALLEIVNGGILPSAIPISTETAPLGANVFTIGFPMAGIMGTEPKFTSGKINSSSGIQNDPRVYQISVPVQSGNSGGPLVNLNGEVVGVVTSKLHAVKIFQWTGDLPQNVNYAIKAFYIKPLIMGDKKKEVKVLPKKKGTYEELVHRIRNSIYMVIAK